MLELLIIFLMVYIFLGVCLIIDTQQNGCVQYINYKDINVIKCMVKNIMIWPLWVDVYLKWKKENGVV